MTTYLVRHASAGTRDSSDPDDGDRQLDPKGVAQAASIGSWLESEPIERILTSPLRRCVQTVEPLAQALGVEVEAVDALHEGAPIDETWALLSSVADGCVVICSHGDVIPDVLRRAEQRGLELPSRSGCKKGSVWALSGWDGQCFRTGTYTAAPSG